MKAVRQHAVARERLYFDVPRRPKRKSRLQPAGVFVQGPAQHPRGECVLAGGASLRQINLSYHSHV